MGSSQVPPILSASFRPPTPLGPARSFQGPPTKRRCVAAFHSPKVSAVHSPKLRPETPAKSYIALLRGLRLNPRPVASRSRGCQMGAGPGIHAESLRVKGVRSKGRSTATQGRSGLGRDRCRTAHATTGVGDWRLGRGAGEQRPGEPRPAPKAPCAKGGVAPGGPGASWPVEGHRRASEPGPTPGRRRGRATPASAAGPSTSPGPAAAPASPRPGPVAVGRGSLGFRAPPVPPRERATPAPPHTRGQ